MRHLLFALSILGFACSSADTDNLPEEDAYVDEENLIYQLLADRGHQRVDSIISQPSRYGLQVMYTQINRDSANRPSFTSHYYGVDSNTYFYPASTVKLPIALLALEKINELGVEGLTKHSPLRIDSAYDGQTRVEYDSTAESGKPSVAQYARKIFVVSDNDAYNRLYEFLGQDYINDQLARKGYENFKIVHRLSVFNTVAQNQNTNPIEFYENGKVLYQQDLISTARSYNLNIAGAAQGRGYMRNDSLVNEPKDFSENNTLSVRILQDLLKSVIFPEAMPEGQRFNLTDEDYRFLYRYMSQLPRETTYPNYAADTSENYYDSYSKFFLFGDSQETVPDNVRVFNKIGMAYGYLTDNAYVVDFENNVEFLLTAVIYVNDNQIFNDDQYEYEETGLPFLAELGRAILAYEQQRERTNTPDLSKFRVEYDR